MAAGRHDGEDIASEVARLILKHGGEGTSFESNIRALKLGETRPEEVAGRRTTSAQLHKGGTVSFDFGATFEGYASDFGRTVFIGEPDPELLTCHKLVMDAQAAAMAMMKTGQASCQDADRTARGVIADGGYGQYFTHRLGHSIGKDMHETPWLIEGESATFRPTCATPSSRASCCPAEHTSGSRTWSLSSRTARTS